MPKMRAEIVQCRVCSKTALVDLPITQVARQLVALEHLEHDGWGYVIGFASMFSGDHAPICPDCNKSCGDETGHLR